MPLQVFISYARKDNESPGDDPSLEGFVTFLHKRLREELTGLGASTVALWRDTRNINATEQFEPILQEQIDASSMMLVVMSPNWMASDNCRREVEQFAARWSHEGERAVKSRIKVVRKRPNDRAEWPAWLRGQEGLSLYSDECSSAAGIEDDLYWHGKVRDDVYYVRVRALAGILSSDAHPPPPPPTGRTLYLARPAADMIDAHDRVVRELAGRGYAVVPTRDIPLDATAVDFVDAAVASSDLSIHLLGVDSGYSPQGASPIVKLQFDRAARLAAADSGFKRILWAPKLVDTRASVPAVERDPLEVIRLLGGALPNDKFEGRGMSEFVESLARWVDKPPPPAPFPQPQRPGQRFKLYLCHEPGDADFALQLAMALRTPEVEPLIPIIGSTPRETRAHHKQRLADCGAVALCWASTHETQVSAKLNELKNWSDLKREKPFAYRALVKGPPRDPRKAASEFIFASDQIDIHLELGDDRNAWPGLLAPLTAPSRS